MIKTLFVLLSVLSLSKPYEDAEFNHQSVDSFGSWVCERVVYPEVAKNNGIEGIVVVMFKVTKEGKVTDIRTLDSVHSELSAEVERVVRLSPRWKPARINGTAIDTYYTLPINFELIRSKK